MPSFRYRKEYSKLFGTVYRPVAEVYFKDAEGKDLISFMYVDSGADITLLPRELGENLDLTIEEEKIQEISGGWWRQHSSDHQNDRNEDW